MREFHPHPSSRYEGSPVILHRKVNGFLNSDGEEPSELLKNYESRVFNFGDRHEEWVYGEGPNGEIIKFNVRYFVLVMYGETIYDAEKDS